MKLKVEKKRVINYEGSLGKLKFVNHYGHGVNVYNESGAEVDFFNIGDFAKDTVTDEEFREGVKNHIEMEEELNS